MEDLKNTWSLLNDKLRRQELLKENIIKGMLESGSGKALNRLINYTYAGIVLCFMAIGVLAYRLTSVYFGPLKTSIFIAGMVLLMLAGIAGILNVVLLQKIDVTKRLNENIRLVQTYRMRVRKQSMAAYLLMILLVVMAVAASFMSPNMELWRWIAIGIAVIIGVVLCIWEYKRMYTRNIDTMLKNMQELKELEE